MIKKEAVANAGRTYWHEAEARRVIQRWQQSGEPLAAFARRRGLNRRRLVRWVSRLRESPPTAVQFHPVRITGRDASAGRAATIEIDCGTRHRVRVSPGFAAEDLRHVLAVLEAVRPC